MAVALAKRYCRDDKFEMEWAEFLRDEVEKFRRHAESAGLYHDPVPKPQAERQNERDRRASFMAHTELLRRACLICGRWGTPEANRAIGIAIQSFTFFSRVTRSGDKRTILDCENSARAFASTGTWPDCWAETIGPPSHDLQKLRLREINGTKDAVMVLPFQHYKVDEELEVSQKP